MDLRSGQPYWLVRNGLPFSFPALDRDLRCDVAVIGGGITGALVAYRLIKDGISAVVLDKRDIGWGSTAASTSLLQYEIDYPLHELREIVGREQADESYRACRDGIYMIRDLVRELDSGCGFAFRPSVYLAKRLRDAGMMRREFEARRSAGFEVEFWDETAVSEKMAFRRPAAIFSTEAARVDAYQLTYQTLRSAQRLGLLVYDRTQVLRIEEGRSGVVVHTSRGGTVRARHVVFATGYETREIAKRKWVSLTSSFALVTEPIPGAGPLWHEDCLIWERAKPYLYVRTTDDRRIIMGGEDEPFQDPDKRDALISRKTGALLRKFGRLFPHLTPEVAFAWAGTFGETRDGLPYVDCLPDSRRVWYALGFGGNGITYSAVAAEIIRDQVLEKPNRYADLFRFGRGQGAAH